ncbi:MAG: hypothetical protein ACI9DF_001351, partial [Verrucomicrobiales bacterium]
RLELSSASRSTPCRGSIEVSLNCKFLIVNYLRYPRIAIKLVKTSKNGFSERVKLAALDPAFRFSLLSIIPLVSHA